MCVCDRDFNPCQIMVYINVNFTIILNNFLSSQNSIVQIYIFNAFLRKCPLKVKIGGGGPCDMCISSDEVIS